MTSTKLLVGLTVLVLVPLALQEFYGWCGWLASWLVRRASRLLPIDHRARCEKEWLQELGSLQGRNVAALAVAVGIVLNAPYVRQALRRDNEPHLGQAPAGLRFLLGSYVTIIIAMGVLLTLWSFTHGSIDATRPQRSLFLVLVVLAVIAEVRPVYVPSRIGATTHSSAYFFYFALVLGWGIAAGVPAVAASSIIAGLLQRRLPVRAVFNAAQHGLAAGAAGLALNMGDQASASLPANPLVLLGAALTFAILNTMFVRGVFVLMQPAAELMDFREHWPVDVAAWLLLAMTAPLIQLVIQHGLLLAPLMLLPGAAVHVVARVGGDWGLKAPTDARNR